MMTDRGANFLLLKRVMVSAWRWEYDRSSRRAGRMGRSRDGGIAGVDDYR